MFGIPAETWFIMLILSLIIVVLVIAAILDRKFAKEAKAKREQEQTEREQRQQLDRLLNTGRRIYNHLVTAFDAKGPGERFVLKRIEKNGKHFSIYFATLDERCATYGAPGFPGSPIFQLNIELDGVAAVRYGPYPEVAEFYDLYNNELAMPLLVARLVRLFDEKILPTAS